MIEAHFVSKFDDADAVDMSDTTTSITEENIKELQILADRYPHAQSAIIPMLHLVQSIDGKVSGEGVRHIARILDIPEAVVLGVVTFYTMFHKDEVGKHLIGVCTTSLCAVMGGDLVYETVRKHLGLDGEGTTEDGAFTLERVECNAACDFAPVMMLNWEYMDNMTPRKAVEILDKLRNDEEVHSTRGPQITSWRDNERVLAGFNDGRSDEGPAAGHASLAGWRIAYDVNEGE